MDKKSPKRKLPEINSPRLFVVGDVHAEYELLAEVLRQIPPKSAVVFLGDYEAYNGQQLLEFCNYLTEFELRCFLVRGNHDHPFFWQQENMRNLISEHTGVELLSEVSAYTWKGRRILTVNGAVSVDRSCVRHDEGKCWPVNEGVHPNILEVNQNLVDTIGDFDVLLSHAGYCEELPVDNPFTRSYASTDDSLLADMRGERELLLKTLLASRAKLWVFGHLHRNYTGEFCGAQLHCLDICRAGELVVNDHGALELHLL